MQSELISKLRRKTALFFIHLQRADRIFCCVFLAY